MLLNQRIFTIFYVSIIYELIKHIFTVLSLDFIKNYYIWRKSFSNNYYYYRPVIVLIIIIFFFTITNCYDAYLCQQPQLVPEAHQRTQHPQEHPVALPPPHQAAAQSQGQAIRHARPLPRERGKWGRGKSARRDQGLFGCGVRGLHDRRRW